MSTSCVLANRSRIKSFCSDVPFCAARGAAARGPVAAVRRGVGAQWPASCFMVEIEGPYLTTYTRPAEGRAVPRRSRLIPATALRTDHSARGLRYSCSLANLLLAIYM